MEIHVCDWLSACFATWAGNLSGGFNCKTIMELVKMVERNEQTLTACAHSWLKGHTQTKHRWLSATCLSSRVVLCLVFWVKNMTPALFKGEVFSQGWGSVCSSFSLWPLARCSGLNRNSRNGFCVELKFPYLVLVLAALFFSIEVSCTVFSV